MYRRTEIGKRIGVKELEEILIKAAKDVGLKADSVDEFRSVYRLGSVHEEKQYIGTRIRLKKGIIPIAEIGGIGGYGITLTDEFSIFSGFGYGFGTKRRIEEYLNAVSKYI